jgi:uncharacterized protein
VVDERVPVDGWPGRDVAERGGQRASRAAPGGLDERGQAEEEVLEACCGCPATGGGAEHAVDRVRTAPLGRDEGPLRRTFLWSRIDAGRNCSSVHEARRADVDVRDPGEPRQRPLEWIDPDECRRLLACSDMGRIAVDAGGAPIVFPVTFAMDGDAVVFRTGEGTKLHAAGRGPACFEVDAFDRTTRSGWSVVVQGRLEEVTRYDATTRARLEGLGLVPWLEDAGDHWMRLVPTSTTGRRLGAPA